MKNSQTLSRVLTVATVTSLVFALNVSGALAGFWRTIDGISATGVLSPSSFLYGLGWDGNSSGYGYGYAFGYGDFSSGYAASSSSSSTSSSSSGGGGGGSSSSSSSSTSSSSSSSTSSSGGTGISSSSSSGGGSTSFTVRSYEDEAKIATCGNSIVNFSDISGTTFEQYIKDLEKISGLNGNASGTDFNYGEAASKSFQPNRAASRSEYVKMVLRALCIDYSNENATLNNFSDTGVEEWQAKVINKAAKLGWISTSNSTFRVNDTISRGESLKMIMLAGVAETLVTPTTSSFADVDTGSWQAKYTENAKNFGIINGQTVNGTLKFRPVDNILRGESTKMIMNTLYPTPMN